MAGSIWKVHKFGGSSLADAECFARVADIVASLPEERVGVVVSAMHGMTNSLLHLSDMADGNDHALDTALKEIGQRYANTATELLNGNVLDDLLGRWRLDERLIKDILGSPSMSDSTTQRNQDIVAGYGEIWSARLLAAVLKEKFGESRFATWLDAREFITVRKGDLGPVVLWDQSKEKIGKILGDEFSGVVVMTGFIAVDEAGLQTTLGRNGSDYSAAILAGLTCADELSIWTDVDGVMSADPNRVPEAQIIHSLSYREAMELAYFGAKVLHPQTLMPAVENDIAVFIRNSFRPEHPGSRIGSVTTATGNVKGITAVSGISLINIEGTGMIGVPGTADRLFAALKEAGVSVTLISQASSEHSICIAVPSALAGKASSVISAAFAKELEGRQIHRVEMKDNQSIVAVVGDGMAGSPGVAARFFGNLARAGINVRAIAQGSSERNISAVVNSDDVTRALRAVHSGFYLSAKTISVGIIGAGVVGATFLDQLHRQSDRLREKFNLDIRVRAIAKSRHMLSGDRRIELETWRETLEASRRPTDIEAFEAHVHADHLPHAVIIDCTADEDISGCYGRWLERGIHVITPNKKAFSGDYGQYAALAASASVGNSHFLYETTVGAALPVIKTIRDLVDTGDRIHAIRGILSGTLAYLFNVYDGSQPFSKIVSDAKLNGYTEPDPREDLSGMDVARKLTILARELGQKIKIGDFPVQNLIPEALRKASVDEFLTGLPRYDDEMLARYESARNDGASLRYIATLNNKGEAYVGLEKVSADDPFSNMQLTDNLVQFTTDRYSQNPLVIQGPGAGPDVTAGGVFGDLLKLSSILGDEFRS